MISSVAAAILAIASTPVDIEISANKKWQDSNITVSAGEVLTVRHKSGQWRGSKNDALHGPEGPKSDVYDGQDGYPLPGRTENALVARIGNGPVFFVGANVRHVTSVSGKLMFVINDDLDGRHGQGLSDNEGSVTMEVKVK